MTNSPVDEDVWMSGDNEGSESINGSTSNAAEQSFQLRYQPIVVAGRSGEDLSPIYMQHVFERMMDYPVD